MPVADLLTAALLDPFRIGLMLALVLTASNTAAQTGRIVPLVLGVVFVAVLIATTTGAGEAGLTTSIAVGVVANAIILGVILAGKALWSRLTGPRD